MTDADDYTVPAYLIKQQPQRQDSLREQLKTLHVAATRLGCYDAADWIWKQLHIDG